MEYLVVDEDLNHGFLEAINGYRSDKGQPPLCQSKELTELALERARKIIRGDDPESHRTHNGDNYIETIGTIGSQLGENLFFSRRDRNHPPTTMDEILTAWINSPKHQLNLIRSFHEFGFGMVTMVSDCNQFRKEVAVLLLHGR